MNLNVNKIIFWQGTGRIIDACRLQQVPEPQWSINGDFIVVTFPRPNVPQDIALDKWIENQIASLGICKSFTINYLHIKR